MGTFLVEGYLAAGTAERLREFRDAASRASLAMAREGIRVVYLSGVILPGDQAWLGLFQAAGREHVSSACHRAGLPCDRIAEAVLDPPGAGNTAPPQEGEISEKPA